MRCFQLLVLCGALTVMTGCNVGVSETGPPPVEVPEVAPIKQDWKDADEETKAAWKAAGFSEETAKDPDMSTDGL
jgi:hypothetical protein